MKYFLLVCLVIPGYFSQAQKSHLNTKRGLYVSGYDVVSYWENDPGPGKNDFEYGYQGATFRFTSKANLEKFMNDPEKYLPEYGGWCAYAMATSGDKVKVNPMSYEIRNGRLFLFYDFWRNDTLKSWREENPEVLIPKADRNWEKILKK